MDPAQESVYMVQSLEGTRRELVEMIAHEAELDGRFIDVVSKKCAKSAVSEKQN
jgi:hypothetical protein